MGSGDKFSLTFLDKNGLTAGGVEFLLARIDGPNISFRHCSDTVNELKMNVVKNQTRIWSFSKDLDSYKLQVGIKYPAGFYPTKHSFLDCNRTVWGRIIASVKIEDADTATDRFRAKGKAICLNVPMSQFDRIRILNDYRHLSSRNAIP